MSVLLLSGSPSERSRSAALLDAVGLQLQARGLGVERLFIRDLSPQALILGDVAHPSLAAALSQVRRARELVLATPIYKAAYSGVLKVFLDVLPQSALENKTVLPLTTGGSPHHMLAIDYALRPVLQSLAARHVLPGVYVTDSQVVLVPEGGYQVGPDARERLTAAVDELVVESAHRRATFGFEPVALSRVRCSP